MFTKNEVTMVQGIQYSNYIMIWLTAGGKSFGRSFKAWLAANGLTDAEIYSVLRMTMEMNDEFTELFETAQKYVNNVKLEKTEIGA